MESAVNLLKAQQDHEAFPPESMLAMLSKLDAGYVLDRSVEVWDVLSVGRLAEHLALNSVEERAHRLHCLGRASVGVSATSSTAEAAATTSRREASTATTVTSSTSSAERHDVCVYKATLRGVRATKSSDLLSRSEQRSRVALLLERVVESEV